MKLIFTVFVISLGLQACNNNGESNNKISSQLLITDIPGKKVSGIDVSSYQNEINWPQVKSSGLTFAYARATMGSSSTDSKFVQNWSGMQSAGINRGAYHYFHSDQSPSLQAMHFLSISNTSISELIPMLDVESIAEGVSKDELQAGVIEWLEYVSDKIGCDPIIYTDHSFADQYLDDPKLAKYKLWIAEYEVNAPNPTSTWGQSWSVWQHSDTGNVSGISGDVDVDVFNTQEGDFKSQMKCDS